MCVLILNKFPYIFPAAPSLSLSTGDGRSSLDCNQTGTCEAVKGVGPDESLEEGGEEGGEPLGLFDEDELWPALGRSDSEQDTRHFVLENPKIK